MATCPILPSASPQTRVEIRGGVRFPTGTFASILGGNVHQIMLGVGVVEIIAGILVGIAPQIGAYIVMLWLWGIIVNLLLVPGYFDIALRDFGLSLGALALAQFSQQRRVSSNV